jgi:hypothetical protein
MIDYEYMYRALVRRLVEIADAAPQPAPRYWRRVADHDRRVADYDRVARAHEPNIKEEGNVS